MDFSHYFREYPDRDGFFGPYGGAELAPELIEAFREINDAYQSICQSSKFINELRRIRREFQGRPTPISHLERLSNSLGNVQLYAKREDLNHTGAHKLNHCMGEVLLAKHTGPGKPLTILLQGWEETPGVPLFPLPTLSKEPSGSGSCVGGHPASQ